MQGARCRHSSTRAHPGATKDPLANTKSLNRSGGIDLSQSKGPGEPGPNSRDALVVSTNFSKRADARPTVYSSSRSGNYTFPGARAGGLMAYGPYRRVGVLAGKVLQGANPAALPIERPTKFELILNLRTADALGLSVPASLLLRADEVIE
jgi:hypothetical protein